MLYLAETQRKTGFMGNGKAEFRLLACQRSEHDWSAVPGDEVIPAPDDASYGSDTLVMIDLNNGRQVQRHEGAGRALVNILQSFSSLSKKFKSQGEEIEQWKESLTYQSQALNRREMEMEARQEEIDQAEVDLAQIEAQKQEIEAQRVAVEAQKADIDALQAELARKNLDLEGAWAHLNGEIQRFEERQEVAQAEAQENAGHRNSGLSEEQADQMRAAIARLGEATISAAAAEAELTIAFDLISHYQAEIGEKQQILDQKRSEVVSTQADLTAQQAALSEAQRSLSETELALGTTQSTLQQQQSLLGAKQEQNQLLTEQLKNQTNLHQQMYKLLNVSDKVRLSKKVDVAALEAMSEADLQALVSKLEQDLARMSHFVDDQEEELRLQQEDIDALQSQADSADEYERLQLETEIAEEKDRHVMLNRTLVGQRRNMLEREEVLSQHQAVLLRRQGLAADGPSTNAAELEPLLNEIDNLRARLGEQIQQVEAESADIQAAIDGLKQTRQQQQEMIESHRQAVDSTQETCCVQQQTISEAQGQIALYESLLPSIASQLEGCYEKLEAISAVINQMQAVEAQQQMAIADAQQIVQALGSAEPALVS